MENKRIPVHDDCGIRHDEQTPCPARSGWWIDCGHKLDHPAPLGTVRPCPDPECPAGHGTVVTVTAAAPRPAVGEKAGDAER